MWLFRALLALLSPCLGIKTAVIVLPFTHPISAKVVSSHSSLAPCRTRTLSVASICGMLASISRNPHASLTSKRASSRPLSVTTTTRQLLVRGSSSVRYSSGSRRTRELRSMGLSENRQGTTGVEEARISCKAQALSHDVYRYNAKQPQETADNITVILSKRKERK